MYLVRKNIKQNNKEVSIPLFITDKEYAERYTKYHNKGIKLFQSAAKEQYKKDVITDEDIVNIMNSHYAVNDFILTKDDLYKDIFIDFIEVPFYEGKKLEDTFVPDATMRSLILKHTYKFKY